MEYHVLVNIVTNTFGMRHLVLLDQSMDRADWGASMDGGRSRRGSLLVTHEVYTAEARNS